MSSVRRTLSVPEPVFTRKYAICNTYVNAHTSTLASRSVSNLNGTRLKDPISHN